MCPQKASGAQVTQVSVASPRVAKVAVPASSVLAPVRATLPPRVAAPRAEGGGSRRSDVRAMARKVDFRFIERVETEDDFQARCIKVENVLVVVGVLARSRASRAGLSGDAPRLRLLQHGLGAV